MSDDTITVERLSPASIVDKVGQDKRLQRKLGVGEVIIYHVMLLTECLWLGLAGLILCVSDYVLFILLLPML